MFLDLLRSETAASPDRMARALAGVRAYQQAPRRDPPAPAPVIAQAGRVVLRDYAPGAGGRPVLLVPSLINPPGILDLSPERSLLRWLGAQGLRPLLLDWGSPAPDEAALDIAAHVEALLLPLMAVAGRDAALAGYCLGGTMAIAAAALRPPERLVLIAAPWRFGGYPQAARDALLALWTRSRGVVDQMGLFPMELLQTAFWQLDPARTIGKFERLADIDPAGADMAGFVALEDWANDGPPLTAAAAAALFEDLYRDDRSGRGRWRIGGRTIDPGALRVPILDISSARDRIVPHAAAARVGEQMCLDLGHVGMIVGRDARAALWAPLARWLAAARPG